MEFDTPESKDVQLNQQLDRLMVRYRAACPTPEPSANFMPGVWAKIEARRGWLWHARIYARRIALAAAAASALIVGVRMGTTLKHDALISKSYVDVLQEAAATEDFAYLPAMEVSERSE
jgi:hypothetical protein